MEGIMMRGPKESATAVRLTNGTINIKKEPTNSVLRKYKFLNIPVLRGCVAFFESMVIGVKSLMYSAEFFDIEEDETQKKSKFEEYLEQKLGDKLTTVIVYFSVIVSLLFSIGLFMLLPTVLVGFVSDFTNAVNITGVWGRVIPTFFEGILRIAIFLIYLAFVSKMDDIKRVFMYHGAEHKTIFCYESGEELTVENVRKYKRLHPRCGTNFIFIVMLISILVFSFLKWDNMILRLVFRLLLLPVVAGISYEIIKLAGRYDNAFTKTISWPGMMLQKITTKEPDDSMIEVAIEALKAVLTDNPDDDKW